MAAPPRAVHKDNMTCGSVNGFASPINFGTCAFPSWQVNTYARGLLETCCGGSDIIPSADGCFFYCAIETTKDVDEFKSCLSNISPPEWHDYFDIKCSNIVGAALNRSIVTSSGETSEKHPKTITQAISNSSSPMVSSTVTPPSNSNTVSIPSTITITSTSSDSLATITAIKSPNLVNSTLTNSTISIPSSALSNSSSIKSGNGTMPTSITAAPPTDIPTAPPAAPTSSTSTSAASHASALKPIGKMAILSITMFSVLNL